MAVRFVIGRAGTGKTALCVREMRAEMKRDALGGGALLWIVPEQGTFSAERLLLAGEGGGGTFRGQVLGFRRLAMLVAGETGGAAGGRVKPMDDIARAVLLEEMVQREKTKLTVFRAAAERPGFVAKLDVTLQELRQHGHSGRLLRELVEAGMDAVMSRKLLDLAVLLDAWSVELEQSGLWDFEQVMHAAAMRVGDAPLIIGAGTGEGARVWVDAFSAMSALEVRMLAALGTHARELTITLLADPDAEGMREMRAGTSGAGEMGLFSRTERLHRRLVDEFRRLGVRMGKTVALREPHRFLDPKVGYLERELFADMPAAFTPADEKTAEVLPKVLVARGKRGITQRGLFDEVAIVEGASADRAAESAALPTGAPVDGARAVEVWECSDPETEVRAVARAIRGMVIGTGARDSGALRCRQIAVIVPDLEGYHDALRRVFAECGIPHFIDQRRGIAHHPLVELLRSAVAIVAERWDRDDLMLYLKTGLVGISQEDVALVENYLIEHGLSHVTWEQAWTWVMPNEREVAEDVAMPVSARERLRRANEVRETVWTTLREFVEVCGNTGGAGSGHFALGLRELLARLGVEERMRLWAEAARARGETELAQIHEQAMREILRILELLEELLAARPRTLAEFQRLLEGALEKLTLGLIPPTVDQVLVSSVARSRVPEMEVVFVIGAVEGQFPKVVEEDVILSDEQRAAFNARAADPIGEGSDRQLLEMPFLDYVALTRGRRRLVVSHPVADRKGKALAASRHVARLEDLLGEHLGRRFFSAESHTSVEGMSTGDDLLAGAAGWARHMVEQARRGEANAAVKDGGDEALMPAVYNLLAETRDERLARDRVLVWKAIVPRREPALSGELADWFYPPNAPLRLSISQLEKFAACPLQYFLHYTLRLRPRAEFQLDQVGMGQLQHDILERVYRRIADDELEWPQDARGLLATLRAEIDAATAALHGEMAEQLPGYEAMRARLNRILGIILEADRRRGGQGDARPAAVEVYFGAGDRPRYEGARLVSLPVLKIGMNGPRQLEVNGKIDRMDLSGGGGEAVVIDYKSSTNKSMDLSRVLEGLSLQLPVYALVMGMLPDTAPIAALYINLGLYLRSIEHAGEAETRQEDTFYQRIKPRGLVSVPRADVLDHDLEPASDQTGQGISAWYKLQFNKKDGAPRKDGDLLAEKDFLTVLRYAGWKVGQLGGALAAGQIAPGPYRLKQETPCNYCDFMAICPFDHAAGTFREVPKLKRDEALAAMRATERNV